MASRPDTAGLPLEAVRRLQQIANQQLGLEIRSGKELVIAVRAARHMREIGVARVDDYLRIIEKDESGDRLRELLDLLTTNHTAFWRESGHFEWFARFLSVQKDSAAPQTVWCAAASSGEEPYTLAMIGQEVFGRAASSRLRILATDISSRVLRTAQSAVYGADRVAPLPNGWVSKYFEPARGRGGFSVRREVREMVHFRRLNLVRPFPSFGPFPVVFCRNVMIYFSKETRTQIVEKLLGVIRPGGFLVVGHAEGLAGLEAEVSFVGPAIYCKKPDNRSDMNLDGALAVQGARQWQHS